MSRSHAGDVRRVRCAIYTRKSSEEGLDQAFNSLHAQREACEAYVRSQAAEGWVLLPTLYDDGGFSGGNMDRPALARLLADVDDGGIDIVVLYKVDRLTRSLSDFARIVDRLDGAGASFVSVTQAFNTTTSMGRLTLNVLLSFAQFEREVTGERIRDKIAASKAKGMWMGGNLPLGYDPPTDPKTRALLVNPAEAETVRRIFRLYLEENSVHALARRLDAEGIRSKRWVTKQGNTIGGVRLVRGALNHLLKNRTYIGEIPHGSVSYPGAHPAIVDLELFDAVQARLKAQAGEYGSRPTRAATMPLKGKLFDVDGYPMSPTFTRRPPAKVYRYYASAPLQQGGAVPNNPTALRRVSAGEVEEILQIELANLKGASAETPLPQLLIGVRRVVIAAEHILITYAAGKAPGRARAAGELSATDPTALEVHLPIRCKRRGGRTFIAAPTGQAAAGRRNLVLINGLRRAHMVAREMGWAAADGSVAGAIKAPEGYDRQLCRLAFLAPDIQRLILGGRQPATMNLESLVHGEIPTCWDAQRRLFGITA